MYRAPGMKYRHYAPKAPVTVVQGAPAAAARYIQDHMAPGDGVICFDEYAGLFDGHPLEQLGPSTDVPEQARRVFDALRWFDGTDVQQIRHRPGGGQPAEQGGGISHRPGGVRAATSRCADFAGHGAPLPPAAGTAAEIHKSITHSAWNMLYLHHGGEAP